MCYSFIQLAAQVCLHQHHHKHMSNVLCYDIRTAMLAVGDSWIFHLHYNLRQPPLYMKSVVNWNVICSAWMYWFPLRLLNILSLPFILVCHPGFPFFTTTFLFFCCCFMIFLALFSAVSPLLLSFVFSQVVALYADDS